MPICYFVFICLASFIHSQVQYRYVYSIVRHGSRAPSADVDSYGEHWYHEELTVGGRRMHYLAGLRDREKYKNFLSDEYDPKEVYLFSTQVLNRTIDSLQARMQGLYNQDLLKGPQLNDEQLSDSLYPPIQINTKINSMINRLGSTALKDSMQVTIPHMLKIQEKYEFLDSPVNCPMILERMNTPSFHQAGLEFSKSYYEKYKDVFINILKLNLTVFDFQAIIKLSTIADETISNYYDARSFTVLRENGFNDERIKELFEDSKVFFKDKFYKYVYGKADNYEIAKAKSKAKYLEIFSTIDRRIEYDKYGKGDIYEEFSLPKVVYFLAHDISVAAFTSTLIDTFNIQLPDNLNTEFACEVNVELLATKIVNHFYDYKIRIVYNEVELLVIPYDEFKSAIERNVMQVDVEEFCNGSMSKISTIENILGLTVIFEVFIVLLILIYLMLRSLYPPIFQKAKKGLLRESEKLSIGDSNNIYGDLSKSKNDITATFTN